MKDSDDDTLPEIRNSSLLNQYQQYICEVCIYICQIFQNLVMNSQGYAYIFIWQATEYIDRWIWMLG